MSFLLTVVRCHDDRPWCLVSKQMTFSTEETVDALKGFPLISRSFFFFWGGGWGGLELLRFAFFTGKEGISHAGVKVACWGLGVGVSSIPGFRLVLFTSSLPKVVPPTPPPPHHPIPSLGLMLIFKRQGWRLFLWAPSGNTVSDFHIPPEAVHTERFIFTKEQMTSYGGVGSYIFSLQNTQLKTG